MAGVWNRELREQTRRRLCASPNAGPHNGPHLFEVADDPRRGEGKMSKKNATCFIVIVLARHGRMRYGWIESSVVFVAKPPRYAFMPFWPSNGNELIWAS